MVLIKCYLTIYTAVDACIQRAVALNIPVETTLSNISSRIIGNFLINQKGISSWGGLGPEWLESLSYAFISSSLNSSLSYDALDIVSEGCAAFTDAVLELYNLDPNNNDLKSSNIFPGIDTVSNNPSTAYDIMLFDGNIIGHYKFNPLKTKILSSSTNGLVKASTEIALINSNLDLEISKNMVKETLNSICNSYFNFLSQNVGDHSLFAYELSKSFSLGSAAAVLTTAEEFADKSEVFTVESFIEFATSEIGKSTIENSLDFTSISIPILAESISNGTALGIQYSTILRNQSLENKFAGINRDIYAKFSSKGIAKGSIEAVSLNIDRFTANSNSPPDLLISEIASHTAKGSVYGNTTLAVYNPHLVSYFQ